MNLKKNDNREIILLLKNVWDIITVTMLDILTRKITFPNLMKFSDPDNSSSSSSSGIKSIKYKTLKRGKFIGIKKKKSKRKVFIL